MAWPVCRRTESASGAGGAFGWKQTGGKRLYLEAGDFIWTGCGESALLLLPGEAHLKAPDLCLASPESGLHPLPAPEAAELLLQLYEQARASLPPLVAADGSLLRREGCDDILRSDAMIEYFKEHVYGKGEYEDPLGCHMGALYDKWLRETYGQTGLEKAASYLTSLEGLQLMLDAVGIFFEPADMVNALIYLCRKDSLSAGLSALSVLPGLGDLLGKGGKYARSAADALFIRAGKAPGGELLLKAGKGWRQVKLQLSLGYQVAARNVEQLLKSLDDVLGQMGKEFSGMLRKVAGQEDVYEAVLPGGGRIRIKLEQMSDVGGAGGKAGKGARNGALKSGSGSVQTISNKFPNDNQAGKRFDYITENGRVHIENGVQNVDFVIDMDGNLHIGRGHSYLAGGSSVQAAGTMKVNSQGYIRLITNESGHFQPTTVQAMNYPTVFRNAGLNIDNAWIRIGEFETSMSNYVIDSNVLYNGPIKNMP